MKNGYTDPKEEQDKKKAIVEQNAPVFSDVFQALDIEMRSLKNRMK